MYLTELVREKQHVSDISVIGCIRLVWEGVWYATAQAAVHGGPAGGGEAVQELIICGVCVSQKI